MTKRNAIHWIGYALDDRENLKSSASGRMHIYVATQVIEKMLKGFLAFSGVDFKPLHNLSYLAALCHEQNPAFAKFLVRIAELPAYNELFRYPTEDDVFYPHADDVKRVVLVMNDVESAVRSLMPSELWDQAVSMVAESRAKYLSEFNPGEWLKDDEVAPSTEEDDVPPDSGKWPRP